MKKLPRKKTVAVTAQAAIDPPEKPPKENRAASAARGEDFPAGF